MSSSPNVRVDRYIARRLVPGALLATVLVAGLTLLLQALRIGHHVAGAALAPLLLAALPTLAGFGLSLGVAAAIVETYGHLAATGELTALRLAGASPLRLARAALLLTLVALAATVALARLEPRALAALQRDLLDGAAETLLRPGRFVDLGAGRTFYAAARRADGTFERVMIGGARAGDAKAVPPVVIAASARLSLVRQPSAHEPGRTELVLRAVLRRAELQTPVVIGALARKGPTTKGLRRYPAAPGRHLRRVSFDKLVLQLDVSRALATHVGFVARVLAAPRRRAGTPLRLLALALLGCAAALGTRSRGRAAAIAAAAAALYVGADAALAALLPSPWALLSLSALCALAATVALTRAR